MPQFVSACCPRLPPSLEHPFCLPSTQGLGRFSPCSHSTGNCTCQDWTHIFATRHVGYFFSPSIYFLHLEGWIRQLSWCCVNAAFDLSSDELVTKISNVPVCLATAHCFQLWSRTFIDCSIHLVLDPSRGSLWFWESGQWSWQPPCSPSISWHSSRHRGLLVVYQSPQSVSLFLNVIWKGKGRWGGRRLNENTTCSRKHPSCLWLRCGGLYLGWSEMMLIWCSVCLQNSATEQEPGVEGWTGNEENYSSTSLSLLTRTARSSGQTLSWFLWLWNPRVIRGRRSMV